MASRALFDTLRRSAGQTVREGAAWARAFQGCPMVASTRTGPSHDRVALCSNGQGSGMMTSCTRILHSSALPLAKSNGQQSRPPLRQDSSVLGTASNTSKGSSSAPQPKAPGSAQRAQVEVSGRSTPHTDYTPASAADVPVSEAAKPTVAVEAATAEAGASASAQPSTQQTQAASNLAEPPPSGSAGTSQDQGGEQASQQKEAPDETALRRMLLEEAVKHVVC